MDGEWFVIPNIDSQYLISKDGKIKNTKTGKITSGSLNTFGYPTVSLTCNGQRKAFLVHRLLLEVFDRPPKLGEEGRHLDGNRSNIDLSNLAWGTRSDNMQDRNKHGWNPSFTSKNKGSLSPRTNLDDQKVIEILALVGQGLSDKQIAEKFKSTKNAIRFIRKNVSWRHIPRL